MVMHCMIMDFEVFTVYEQLKKGMTVMNLRSLSLKAACIPANTRPAYGNVTVSMNVYICVEHIRKHGTQRRVAFIMQLDVAQRYSCSSAPNGE
jgi:hypothetical protein